MTSLLVRLALPLVLASSALVVACGEAETGDPELGEIEQGLQTFPNQGPAFEYFVGKGLSPAQSAGIVGNLSEESGVDPTIKQLGGGPGRGIAQWQVGGRWDTAAAGNVLDFAAGPPARNPLSLDVQLDFIWFELTTIPSYGLTQLRATTTAEDAVLVFKRYYEGCPACSAGRRIEYAEDVLARFGSGSGSSSSSSSSSSGGATGPACVVTTTGEEGACLEVSECAGLGGVSTPGFCPGSSDVQCCTGIDLEDPDPTPGSSSSGGSTRPDAGAGTGTGEDTPENERDPGRIGVAPEEQGCSTSGRTGLQGLGGWLLGLGVVVAGRRFSRRAAG